jgi:hypothetical protein
MREQLPHKAQHAWVAAEVQAAAEGLRAQEGWVLHERACGIELLDAKVGERYQSPHLLKPADPKRCGVRHDIHEAFL